ncbi:unnamed protein product [Rotaria socialis]|uniref:RING-type domain-containing protein n=1 Tax=Rotaria socialis TaxID=392032 RepID=A0A817Q317_9BILA|nr:unnamed protein product [Rotaria socialis]CAF3191873.1 unnamed protein product [Rotaria socialis]CAF3345930.1 unnamed protein product [Rotaria socialis]CAF3587579.1 unnamed protein product [Rotaria socialis]CAF4133699.1 unnamed protein product [Rotaria socialis]
MGNCWRIPEDYSSLVDLPTSPITPSSTDSLSNSNSSFIHPVSAMSDTRIPKLVIANRSSTDLNAIKAAQCRNLVEHLPLTNYDEKINKQTECDICLVDFIANEHVRQLPCDGAHVFHPPCIDTWLEKSLTCPHCSINVDAALLLKFIPKSNKNDDEDG